MDRLKVSSPTFAKYEKSGLLTGRKFGQRRRYLEEEIESIRCNGTKTSNL
jgi:hypothetical protein